MWKIEEFESGMEVDLSFSMDDVEELRGAGYDVSVSGQEVTIRSVERNTIQVAVLGQPFTLNQDYE